MVLIWNIYLNCADPFLNLSHLCWGGAQGRPTLLSTTPHLSRHITVSTSDVFYLGCPVHPV